ncbi:MAG: hypothetical protein U9Q27_01595 [Patescibacteria group bacterium]|nr:hypothetical protein [Patescibacteria group bacterium]
MDNLRKILKKSRQFYNKNVKFSVVWSPDLSIEKIFRFKNPQKYIQLTEKREMSALIIEKGCIFPKDYEINPLKVNALVEIKKEIERIRNNFLERALNELESIYFYNKSWVERIDKLLHTSSGDIINIMNKIEILTN